MGGEVVITIHKHIVTPGAVFAVPKGSEILSVSEQFDQIVLYTRVDTDATEFVALKTMIVGTGHDASGIPERSRFLGTVKLHGGNLMLHVWGWVE